MKPVIFDLLPYIRHSWARKVERQGSLHGANLAMVTGMGFAGFIIQLVVCIAAFRLLNKGQVDGGNLALGFALNIALAGWIITPIMVNSAFDKGRGLEPTRLGQFPLSLRQLFFIGAMGNLVQPVYWLLIGSSLILLVPLMGVAVPLTGIVAGSIYILFCSQISMTLGLFGQAILASRFGRELMLGAVSILAIPFFIIAFADYSVVDDRVMAKLHGKTYLVTNFAGTEGIVAKIKIASPADMVVQAANGHLSWLWISILTAATIAAFGLALWSLQRIIMRPPGTLKGSRKQLKTVGCPFWTPASIGPLVSKEIRYLSRTLDHIIGVVVAAGAFFFVLFKPEHAYLVLPGAAWLVVFDASAIPLNIFGLDGASAERYRLLPLSGRQVLLSKNLAYFFIITTHIVPMVLAGFIRADANLGISLAFTVAAMVLMTASYGNFVSVKSPAPRAFFNFDSKEQVGGVISLIVVGAMWVIPAVIWGVLRLFSETAATGGLILLFAGAVFIYRLTLDSSSRLFEQSAQTMRTRLEK